MMDKITDFLQMFFSRMAIPAVRVADIIEILLLAILAIGAVSASDGHDSDNLTVSNEQTGLDVDKLAVVEDDEI